MRLPPLLCAVLCGAIACAHDVPATAPAAMRHVAAAADRDGEDAAEGRGRPTTFEDFALGVINGQHDWQSTAGVTPTGPVAPCAAYDHEIADSHALIDAPYRRGGFGRRSLRVSNAVTSGCYTDQTFSQRSADVAGETGAVAASSDGLTNFALPGAVLRHDFEAEWTFMSASPAAFQPGLEVVVSPARGDDHRMSWVQMADLADGLAVVFASRADPANPGAFQRDTIARRLDRRLPHTIRLTMEFLDGPLNDVVRVYVDGALRTTGGSWETYYRLDANGRQRFGGATPAVNRLMFRTGSDTHRGVPGDAAPATRGRGFLFDQIRVAAMPARPTERPDDR